MPKRRGQGEATLTLKFSHGSGEFVCGVDHFLAAPFRRVFTAHKRPNPWGHVVILDEDRTPHLFGTVVAGGKPAYRIFFHPAAAVRLSTPAEELSQPEFSGHLVDHLTQEPARSDGSFPSHVTFRTGEKPRGLGWKTERLPGYLVPWFSQRIPSLDSLSLLPKVIRIRCRPARQDLDRLGQQLLDAMVEPAVLLPPVVAPAKSFYQIDVWVGREASWEDLSAGRLTYPDLDRSETVVVTPGDLLLTRRRGVKICVSRPAGSLHEPRLLRPHSPQ